MHASGSLRHQLGSSCQAEDTCVSCDVHDNTPGWEGRKKKRVLQIKCKRLSRLLSNTAKFWWRPHSRKVSTGVTSMVVNSARNHWNSRVHLSPPRREDKFQIPSIQTAHGQGPQLLYIPLQCVAVEHAEQRKCATRFANGNQSITRGTCHL